MVFLSSAIGGELEHPRRLEMSDVLKVSEDHVWIRPQAEGALVGITDFAAEALGRIIYVELPEVGEQVSRGEPFAAVESGKANVELVAPVSGEVLRINEELEEQPDLVNQDSLGKGWIAVLALADASQLEGLMSRMDYDLFVAGAGQ
jgi:glycine cleavage system H protein